MKLQNSFTTVVIGLGMVFSCAAPYLSAQAPDNSKTNKRDSAPNEATADQQKMNPSDRNLTATIRKSIMDDKSLSTYAHNVKIISQDGVVTLKGPVRSREEMKSIVSKAEAAAGGSDKVVNQMAVQP